MSCAESKLACVASVAGRKERSWGGKYAALMNFSASEGTIDVSNASLTHHMIFEPHVKLRK
jgi:hypothetical protein